MFEIGETFSLPELPSINQHFCAPEVGFDLAHFPPSSSTLLVGKPHNLFVWLILKGHLGANDRFKLLLLVVKQTFYDVKHTHVQGKYATCMDLRPSLIRKHCEISTV